MEKLLYDKYIDTLLVLAEVAKTGDERAKQYLTDLIVKMEPDIRRSVVSLFNDFSGLSYTRNKNVLKSYKFDIEDSSNSKHRSFYTRRLKLLQQGESEFYKQRDLCRFIYNCYFNAKDKIKEYDETYFEKNFDAICEYCETEFNTRDFFNYLNLIGWIADRETYDGWACKCN